MYWLFIYASKYFLIDPYCKRYVRIFWSPRKRDSSLIFPQDVQDPLLDKNIFGDIKILMIYHLRSLIISVIHRLEWFKYMQAALSEWVRQIVALTVNDKRLFQEKEKQCVVGCNNDVLE